MASGFRVLGLRILRALGFRVLGFRGFGLKDPKGAKSPRTH